MNNQQNRLVILWLTWQKYISISGLLTCTKLPKQLPVSLDCLAIIDLKITLTLIGKKTQGKSPSKYVPHFSWKIVFVITNLGTTFISLNISILILFVF